MRGVPALGAGGRTFESCHPDCKNLIISSIMGFSVRTSPNFFPFLRPPDSQRQFCVWEIWVLCVLWVYSELQKWEFLLGRRRFFDREKSTDFHLCLFYSLLSHMAVLPCSPFLPLVENCVYGALFWFLRALTSSLSLIISTSKFSFGIFSKFVGTGISSIFISQQWCPLPVFFEWLEHYCRKNNARIHWHQDGMWKGLFIAMYIYLLYK